MKKFYKINLNGSDVFWTSKLKEEELKLYFSVKKILFPNQKHSNLIHWAEKEENFDCDGIFTKNKNFLIGVKTADCVPLIISHKNFVGAIHCGWRGLSKGILDNMLNLIKNENSCIEECSFFLGPSICKYCYEVKEDVGFLFPNFFKEGKLNLKGFILDILIKNGGKLEKIKISRSCTFSNKNLPSYRREKSSGRILTGIFRKK